MVFLLVNCNWLRYGMVMEIGGSVGRGQRRDDPDVYFNGELGMEGGTNTPTMEGTWLAVDGTAGTMMLERIADLSVPVAGIPVSGGGSGNIEMVAVGVPAHPPATTAMAPARGNWADSTVGRVSAVITRGHSSSNSGGGGGGNEGGSQGQPPRGSAMAKFRAAVHVVKVHGFLKTLRAAASREEKGDEEESEAEEPV